MKQPHSLGLWVAQDSKLVKKLIPLSSTFFVPSAFGIFSPNAPKGGVIKNYCYQK